MSVKRGDARSGSIYHMLMTAGVANEIPYCTGANTLEHSANLTWDGTELAVNGDLDVSGDANIGGDLDVVGAIGFDSADIAGDCYVGGDLAVGTTSPNAPLDVRGNVLIGNGSATQPGDVVIQENDNSAAGLNLHLFNESTSGYSFTAIKCYANNGSVEGQFFADGLGSVLSGGGLVFRTFTNHAISFGTNQTERIRLAADGKVGFGTGSPTEVVDVNSDAIRVRSSQTPASAGATGDAGMICWDSNYVYVCVAANTWKRAALSAW